MGVFAPTRNVKTMEIEDSTAGFGVLHSKEMPFCYFLEDRLV